MLLYELLACIQNSIRRGGKLIALKNIKKSFNKNPVLHGIDVTVNKGDIVSNCRSQWIRENNPPSLHKLFRKTR